MTLDEALDYFATRYGWKIARSTYAEMESGKHTPNAEQYRLLTDLWGSEPEKPAAVEAPAAPTPDLTKLITALTEQSRQQAQLITLLTEQNAMLKQLVFERPAAPGHSLTAPASLQAAESAALELGALDLRTEQERDQPAEPRAGAPRGTGRSGTHPR